MHYFFGRFAAGLQVTGVLPKLMSSPSSFMELFCYQNGNVTASFILDLFVPSDLADKGSNKRMLQNKAIASWRDFVLDMEGT